MNIFLDSIGCRLNQSEIETYARQFRAAGHTIVPSAAEADLVVVNTCAVTAEAASDSRQKIRQAARLAGEHSPDFKLALTGCWITLEPAQAASLPGVTHLVPNAQKDALVSDLLGIPAETFDLEPLERQPLPGARLRTRAFIKVQDGCDNHCTFCITTVARGAGRSRPLAAIVADIESARRGGAQEIVLTGVHLGSWGQDFDPPQSLRQLVESLLLNTAVPRLRLSSLEPWDLDAAFFDLWQDPRLCRHLHLPLQSGSDRTLRRMARRTNQVSFARLVEAARRVSPEIALTTDLIAGFPGEDETEFSETLAFVRQMDFAGGHVFTYSPRPGTAAARFSGQVPHPLRKTRNARLRQVLEDSAARYRARFVGHSLDVLWESATALGPSGWTLSGLTDNYLRVTALAPRQTWNIITPVTLTGEHNGALTGQLVLYPHPGAAHS